MNPPLIKRLRWEGSGQPSREIGGEAAVMARSLVYLYLAGATLTLMLFVALPRPEANPTGMLIVIGIAYLVALGALLAFTRMPQWLYPVLVATGTLIISAGIYYRGSPTTAHALFYLWATFYAFYFFSLRVALLELAFSVACYGIVLSIIPEPAPHAIEVWLITLGSLVVAGLLVSMLKIRINRLLARLAEAARRDVLTGLLNRRGFEELFDLEMERARRGRSMLSVIVGDLDHFKNINDQFGHQIGDTSLERAATILKRRKRRIDTVARMGGEEFALIVPDTDEHRAYMLAERLRNELKRSFEDDPVPLTISFGVASFPVHGDKPETLLRAADEALYAAKELGRDRVVIYSAEIAGILTPSDGTRSVARNEHLATVLALAETLDIRDAGTAAHSQTVGHYAALAARELGLEPANVERVRVAGILHDIGKIGIPDAVLSKPGPLDRDELIEIRKHPEIGARILAHASLGDIGEWVLAHHERPDGNGFPYGLNSDEIPIEARILAVADAYEAMTSDRVYRTALGHERAREELSLNTGTQFDHRVVSAFLRVLEREPEQANPPEQGDSGGLIAG